MILLLHLWLQIRDDVRPEVPEAVAKMHDAGVQVMMVTGDVIDTAKAIAKDAGLITSESDIAMSAIDFDALSDEEAKEKLPYIKVIARATPNTKLRIVRLAQELGLCVGMTGDGTNDAPALKAADVGFSMGSGTDVCKEAGDIIITDDNFVSITDAVLLGRTFMHNIMMFLEFQLPINFALLILSIIYPMIAGTALLASVQILIVNIIMDSLNSLSFGGEPPKDEYMAEKPIKKGIWVVYSWSKRSNRIKYGSIYYSVWNFDGTFSRRKRRINCKICPVCFMAVFNGFCIRTDKLNLLSGIGKNKLFGYIAAGIFAGTVLLCSIAGNLIKTIPLAPIQWLTVIGLAFMVVPVDLVRKIANKRRRK